PQEGQLGVAAPVGARHFLCFERICGVSTFSHVVCITRSIQSSNAVSEASAMCLASRRCWHTLPDRQPARLCPLYRTRRYRASAGERSEERTCRPAKDRPVSVRSG